MSNQIQEIKDILKNHFSGDITVVDDGHLHIGHANAGAGHYTIHIIDEKFSGLNRIERHKIVYNILDNMSLKIHALSMKLYTPYEFYKEN